MCKERAETLLYHGSRVSILLNRGSAASLREAADTLPAVPTADARIQNQSAPFDARALTH